MYFFENVCISRDFTREDCFILVQHLDELDKATRYQNEIDQPVAREKTPIGRQTAPPPQFWIARSLTAFSTQLWTSWIS